MFYRVNKEDGYIHSLTKGVSAENSNITEEEYTRIKTIIENSPNAPDGFYYRLKDNLEWELCEVSISEEETADDTDYITALESLGVYFDA